MLRYDDEVKSQVEKNLYWFFFPFVIPIFILSSIFDFKMNPGHGVDFLILRSMVILWALLCLCALKLKVVRRAYNLVVWSTALIISAESTAMAIYSGDYFRSPQLYAMNIFAGLFVFLFTVRFFDAFLTLLFFYFVPAVTLMIVSPFSSGWKHLGALSGGLVLVYLAGAATISALNANAYRQKTRLFFHATTDGLSGLKLRRYFFSRFVQELSLALRLGHPFKMSVAMLDVDDFKKINDTWGHETGDKVIKHISDILKATIRIYDVPCRFGGDEFCILFPEAGSWEGQIICERIRKAIQDSPLRTADKKIIPVTVSIGFSMISGSEVGQFDKIQRDSRAKLILCENMQRVLCQSDRGLLEAKRGGRNCVVAGEAVDLTAEVRPDAEQSLGGNLVYFEQDVFQFGATDGAGEDVREVTELNFYSPEFFCRRAVESMYRSFRNPGWSETIAVIRVETGLDRPVREEMSRTFRLADTLCVLEKNVYGAVFFGLGEDDIRNVLSRINENISRKIPPKDFTVRIAAASLRYEPSLGIRSSGKVVRYEEFSDRVNELFGILRRYRFSKDEAIHFYKRKN